MFCKAILICEDVRLESNGTVTLVGVHNERLIAPPGSGPLVVPRLQFLTVIGGLRGVERLKFRQRLRAASDAEATDAPLREESHNPASDEHNFVFGDGPIRFPGDGEYELATDMEVGAERVTFRYRFWIERSRVQS